MAALSACLQHAHAAHSSGRMPSLFIGHGSPMNALDDNAFTRTLQQLGREIGRPAAILVVSAHWLTPGQTRIGMQTRPPTLHDFGGFPQVLSDMQYPAPGAPAVARQAMQALQGWQTKPATDWGLDHGAWTVLHHLYPHADVPVFQVSVDYAQTGAYHLALGQALSELRDQGVLILGSGNVVHNLRQIDPGAADGPRASRPWAQSFDDAVRAAVLAGDTRALGNYPSLDRGAALAVQTPDHYWPLLYALGAARSGEMPRFVFEGFQLGTLSMRCVRWG